MNKEQEDEEMKSLLSKLGIGEPEPVATPAPESATQFSCLDLLFTSIHAEKENPHLKEKARIKELMNANGFPCDDDDVESIYANMKSTKPINDYPHAKGKITALNQMLGEKGIDIGYRGARGYYYSQSEKRRKA